MLLLVLLCLALATAGVATNAAGEAFLAEKAKEEDVVVLPSGLM